METWLTCYDWFFFLAGIWYNFEMFYVWSLPQVWIWSWFSQMGSYFSASLDNVRKLFGMATGSVVLLCFILYKQSGIRQEYTRLRRYQCEGENGIRILDTEVTFKIALCAYNVTLFLLDEQNITNVLQRFDNFAQISRLIINKRRSKPCG